MNKTTVIALLGLTLAAAACTTEDATPPGELVDAGASTDRVGDVAAQSAEAGGGDSAVESAPEDGTEETASPAAGDDPVCLQLFGAADTLADRVQDSRALIATGEVVDDAELEEITKVRELIDDLAAEGSAEQARAVEQLNEPFVTAIDTVESEGGQDPEGGEVTLPQLDVSGSMAAQDQLKASCEG